MPFSMQSLLAEVSTRGARSSALHPLLWGVGLVLTTLTGCIAAKAPVWVIAGVGAAAGVILLVLLWAFVYLLLNDPDALRSESFSLSKMAMEKGLVGDNINGLIDLSKRGEVQQGVLTHDGLDVGAR